MPLEKPTRARVVEAFNLLGHLAAQELVALELCIYGGSAMMLEKMNLRTLDEVERQIERFYPLDALTTQARGTIEALLARRAGDATTGPT